MTPGQKAAVQVGVIVLVLGGLILLFPKAFAFSEMAASELRYFWWLILLVALALWLIFWGFRKRQRVGPSAGKISTTQLESRPDRFIQPA